MNKKKKDKDKIKIVFVADDHDEKTCFRCRLHDLYMELKETNDLRFMLLAMAEACGSILSQSDELSKHEFMMILTKSYLEDSDDNNDKAENCGPTKH